MRRWEKWLTHNGRRRTRRVAHRKEQHASCTWETELAIRILEPRFRVGPSLKPPRIVTRSPPGRLVRSHLLPLSLFGGRLAALPGQACFSL